MFAGRSAAFWSRSLHEVVIFKHLFISERVRREKLAQVQDLFHQQVICFLVLRRNATQEVLQSAQWDELRLQVKQDAFPWDIRWERESTQSREGFSTWLELLQHSYPSWWKCILKQGPCFPCWKGIFFTFELLISRRESWWTAYPLHTR